MPPHNTHIVILHDDLPFIRTISPDYRGYYSRLTDMAKDRGMSIFHSVAYAYDARAGVFRDAYALDGDRIVQHHAIKADLIWYKNSGVNIVSFDLFERY